MTISITQQVDFLWKKLGYGVAKTEIPENKDATNESIISAPFIPGDMIWSQSDEIPGIIPAIGSSIVAVYGDATANTVRTTMDITATVNRTWLTGLTDWIPIEYGSTYQVKVYLDDVGSATPQTTGVQLYAAGTGADDEWFFDYEAGVLHFIGENLPNQIFTNKRIYVSGARYIGHKGLNAAASATYGNITITGSTISSTGNINFAATSFVNFNGSPITNVGYPTNPTDAASAQYVVDSILALHPNTIYQGDSIVRLSDPTGNAGVLTIAIDGNLMATVSNSTYSIGNVDFSGNTISSQDNIYITPAASKVVKTQSKTAWQIPCGTTDERPLNPEPGYTRFNTTFNGLEVFNGTDWSGTQSQVNSQVIVGDGIAESYALNQNTQANNILVTIHGVVQVPYAAYTVANGFITFNEPPLAGETVEVRYISQAVSPLANFPTAGIIDPPPATIGIVDSVIDSFHVNAFRSAKYTLSLTNEIGDGCMTEIMVVHNDTDTSNVVTSTGFVSNTTQMSYSTRINNSMCELLARSTTANTEVKIQKVYYTR